MQSENGYLVFEQEVDDDPRYRRRRPTHFPPYEPDTSQQDLIRKYLPLVRMTCWIGLVVTVLFSIDYFLSPESREENIVGISWIDRGYGVNFYLIKTPGATIKVYNDRAASFRNVKTMVVKRSRLLNTVMAIETLDGTTKINVAVIYQTLLFFPIVLFITSWLGLRKWNTLEFPFSLSVVTAMLLVINLVLILK